MLETSSLHGTTCYGYDRHNWRISQSQGGQSTPCDYHLPHPRIGIPADDAFTYRRDDGHGSMQAALASTTLQDAGERFDATVAAYDLRGTCYHRAAGRFIRLDSPLPGVLAAVRLRRPG